MSGPFVKREVADEVVQVERVGGSDLLHDVLDNEDSAVIIAWNGRVVPGRCVASNLTDESACLKPEHQRTDLFDYRLRRRSGPRLGTHQRRDLLRVMAEELHEKPFPRIQRLDRIAAAIDGASHHRLVSLQARVTGQDLLGGTHGLGEDGPQLLVRRRTGRILHGDRARNLARDLQVDRALAARQQLL